jgi:hypothetical protein
LKDKLARLFREKVDIKAGGILYRGLLIGADEDYVYLKGETMYITLPIDRVTAIRRQGGDEGDWTQKQIEGAPGRTPEERAGKKLYRDSDLKKIHQPDEGKEWPETEDDPDASEDE